MLITEWKELALDGDWSRAFEEAVNSLANNGGGTLTVPEGTYETGSIELKSHVTLELHPGAVLLYRRSLDAYPLVELEFEGIPGMIYRPCIFARDCEDVHVVGQGTLDGQGDFWWMPFREKKLAYPRPYLVCFADCKSVSLEGITLTNSPCWTVHPLRCEGVTLRGLMIKNPYDSPNTDGMDPNCCRDVVIEECTVDVGDDCIALKAGTEDTISPGPCENIRITGCRFLHGHGGVVLGSEMSGSVRNVQVDHCYFSGTDRGVRLKTRRGRGGAVENVVLQDLTMEGVMCPFVFNMYYFCGKNGKLKCVWDKAAYPVDETTPALRNVTIRRVEAKGCLACAAFFWGLTEQPVEGVTFSDIHVVMDENAQPQPPAMMTGCPDMKQRGLFLRSARNVRFENVKIENVEGPMWDIDESVSVL